uniref:ATP synthase subunit a n=1 Tax=Pseudexostoma brachysoma TaxID=1194550 RepID=A0A0R7FJ78_9TELE|nr:ATP synthase F0 subunit 6 [Pseudexostoma brachysoma]
MTPNPFDQFMSPAYLGIPLFAIALTLPSILIPTPTNRHQNNRLMSLQNWFIKTFTQLLLTPLNQGGHKWAMILASLMMFILTLNIMGLLPYTFTPTTQLSLNMGLAVPLWLATVTIGLRNQPTAALGHLLPEGTPALLIPILIIIETISLFIRPPPGRMTNCQFNSWSPTNPTNHLLITSTATITLAPTMTTVAMLTATLLVLLTLLEVAVAIIQAYVFVLLLSLYLQANV